MADDTGISAGDDNGGPKVSPEVKAIGQRVHQVRRRRGLSLETAAGLAGIHKSFLSRLENGQALPAASSAPIWSAWPRWAAQSR